ncbi:MAG: hypothetical protein BWX55_01114 [Deltaproteobacteria bacterium ADurb.Bin022]|jgi:hypothetical protein|nr:MAG: hypothetical protein BWX55_01114 [Deltaproteobacteria bacterium ADurb.Bin022]
MKGIDGPDDEQKLLLSVRDVLKKHSLTFSEQGIHLIIAYIKEYESSLILPIRPTKSQRREQIKRLRDTARTLSSQIQKLDPHIMLDDQLDSLPSMLDHLIQCCDWSITYYNSKKSQEEGRPVKAFPLKSLVQSLILIAEKETSQEYSIEESNSWGRERKTYNPLIQKFVKSILKYVAPGEDAQEAMKAARRDPVSLDWVRKMQKEINKEFSKKSK